MSFLTPGTVASGVYSSRTNTEAQAAAIKDPALRSRSSIAALVGFVRNPVTAVGNAYDAWSTRDAEAKTSAYEKQIVDSKKQLLNLTIQEAISYESWRAAAEELDTLEGNNGWKSDFESDEYDYRVVASRLAQLEEARSSGDVGKMVFLVRTALTRDLGNMGNVELYKHSRVGTKDLIERYIDVALETLDALVTASARLPEKGPLSHRHILEQVISARQAFGRSALLLSGGGTFGMAHNGVLKVLWEQNLLPRIISGASAGSIVSAIMCTRTDAEIPDLLEEFVNGDLAVFEEEGQGEGIMQKAARFLKHGHLYDISHLERVMKQSLGDMTFQEAYNRTRRILNICVSSASLYELPRLLNYVTAPNVLIWSAVAASCSVPLVFSPASLLAKDTRTGEQIPWNPSPQGWIDGSVENDLPMTRLAEMFNVNHFIVSQVNPHVLPFLEKDESLVNTVEQSSLSFHAAPRWLHTVTHLAKGEALYRLRSMAEFGLLPNALTKAASILDQKYSGDITIMPAIEYTDFTRILKNPDTDFMIKTALAGERATWPKLSRVRNHCAIELALDDAVQHLRARVVFSASQVDLRLGAYTQAKNAARKKHGRHRKDNSLSQRYASTSNPTKPMVRTKRSMSQNSEPDASLIMATRSVKPKGRPGSSASGNSGHSNNSAQSERRPQSIHASYSNNQIFSSRLPDSNRTSQGGSVSTMPFPRRGHAQSGIGPSFSQGPSLPDIASSGAETTGLHTSDDDVEFGSDGSVTSTDVPADSRRSVDSDLFPHASQPSTPFVSQGYRPFNLMLTPASPPNDASASFARGPAGGTPGVGPANMRRKSEQTEPSAVEIKYKQLFHGTKALKSKKVRGSGSTTPKARASPPPTNARSGSNSEVEGSGSRFRKVNALGLEFPIPMRKKTTKETEFS